LGESQRDDESVVGLAGPRYGQAAQSRHQLGIAEDPFGAEFLRGKPPDHLRHYVGPIERRQDVALDLR
jgi:hypothetical protein